MSPQQLQVTRMSKSDMWPPWPDVGAPSLIGQQILLVEGWSRSQPAWHRTHPGRCPLRRKDLSRKDLRTKQIGRPRPCRCSSPGPSRKNLVRSAAERPKLVRPAPQPQSCVQTCQLLGRRRQQGRHRNHCQLPRLSRLLRLGYNLCQSSRR